MSFHKDTKETAPSLLLFNISHSLSQTKKLVNFFTRPTDLLYGEWTDVCRSRTTMPEYHFAQSLTFQPLKWRCNPPNTYTTAEYVCGRLRCSLCFGEKLYQEITCQKYCTRWNCVMEIPARGHIASTVSHGNTLHTLSLFQNLFWGEKTLTDICMPSYVMVSNSKWDEIRNNMFLAELKNKIWYGIWERFRMVYLWLDCSRGYLKLFERKKIPKYAQANLVWLNTI